MSATGPRSLPAAVLLVAVAAVLAVSVGPLALSDAGAPVASGGDPAPSTATARPSGGTIASASSPTATASASSPTATASASSPTATASASSTAAPSSAALDQHAGAERDGQELVVTVPAERVDASETVGLTVRVPTIETADGAGASTETVATRSGDRYVARVPVTDLVGPGVESDLRRATVVVRRDGDDVLEAEADLRYVASAGPVSFDRATLTFDVDARGLGTDAAALPMADGGGELAATVDDVGPNASLRVAPSELRDLDVRSTYELGVRASDAAVPGSSLQLRILDAAAAGARIGFDSGEPIVVQPLLHPAIGPERVEVQVRTTEPRALYVVEGSDEGAALTVPADVLAAGGRTTTVVGGGETLVSGKGLPVAPRDRVPLRIEDGALHAPEPARLVPYDAILLRTDGVTRIPIADELRSGAPQPLPEPDATVALRDGEAEAVLVGPDRRPASASLEVVQPENPQTSAPDVPEPDAEGFVGVWVDVGNGAVLLVLAMVGSAVAVTAAYLVRLVRPAAAGEAGVGAATVHFVLGGIAGVGTITIAQRRWLEPLLDTVVVGGVELGLGAILVGGFYGGVVASAIRIGLGTLAAWPTSYVRGGPSVPVRVSLTDDGGNELPGEQTVEVRRPGTGRVLRTVALGGASTEIELSPGEYGFVGRTGERETDPRRVGVPEPDRTVPEAVEVDLEFGRPALQIELTDAQTSESVDTASVTVTTDSGKTRSETASEGTARLALPVETGSLTVVVEAEGYERTTVEEPIDEQLLTLDVALEPETGVLRATALIDGQPLPDARLEVAPRGDDPPSIGVRTAELETDEDGTAETDLPVGDYAVRLVLEGPNADRYALSPAAATVEAGAVAEATVQGRFEWEPSPQLRKRASELEETIRDVALRATADPTVPLYFAGVAGALLDVFNELPDAGHRFAAASLTPDAVAAAAVDGARATLSAVGRAMQADAVAPVLAAGSEPEQVTPDLDASPVAMLDYLAQDVTVATVEARAERVRERIADEEDDLATVAPARAIVAVATELQEGVDGSLQTAGREYAALLLLEAAEELFDHDPLRRRLANASTE